MLAVIPLVLALRLPCTRLQPDELTVGRVVIPTLARPDWQSPAEFRRVRTEMFASGLYPGVDYRVEARSATELTVRPIYPLVTRLDRSDWPVTIAISLAPRWMDPAAYNLLTAAFALLLAGSGLLVGFVVSLFLTFSYVPSASMQPTIEPADVLLVETLTPRLRLPLHTGDLVFFNPPDALRAIVAERQAAANADAAKASAADPSQSATAASDDTVATAAPARRTARLPPLFAKRELFVKRVVAVPGDQVTVTPAGSVRVRGIATGRAHDGAPAALAAAAPSRAEVSPPGLASLLPTTTTALTVPEAAYFVAGDNAQVSIDSRVWGVLPADKVVGRPVLRVLPLSRFGWVK